MTNLDMSFAEALKKHRAGDLRGAEIAYRALLSDHPFHAAALHFFGLLLHQRGKSHEALPYLEKSLQINSSKASFYNNHGVVLMTLDRPDEAEASFRKAIEMTVLLPLSILLIRISVAARPKKNSRLSFATLLHMTGICFRVFAIPEPKPESVSS